MDRMCLEISCLEIIYHSLSEETRAIITFPQYAAYRNPHWREEDILHGIIIADKKRKEPARWWEEQRNPTPIRSTQPCHYCKEQRGLETPRPLGVHNLDTIARGCGNQIIGAGVRIRSTLLRHTMIVMMRCVRMER
jgi:hypothetical protein